MTRTAPAEDSAGVDPSCVFSRRRMQLNGRSIEYEAEAGFLPIEDKAGERAANMFMVAYTVAPAPESAPRPLTFVCNGGPGSSSIWLHMGGFGPVRTPIGDPPHVAAAPYSVIENDACLLDVTDIVFLDAVGTGYSTVCDPANERLYWGIDADAAAFAQAIRFYVNRKGRSNDPKYFFGESYGAMRAAIVVNLLRDKGVALSGLILLSGILSFAHFAPYLDQQAIDLLPSYAATAWHHKRVAHEGSFNGFLEDVRSFARGAYAHALAQGHNIGGDERDAVARRLEAITGIKRDWWMGAQLRAGIDAFRREILRDRGLSVGAADTRYVLEEGDQVGERPSADASSLAAAHAYQAAFEDYVVRSLGFSCRREYIASDLPRIMQAWDWSHQPVQGAKQNALASAVPDLAHALRTMPNLNVLVLCGLFDLMTPFFGAEYDLGKLYLSEHSRERVRLRHYEAGHMLYTAESVRAQLASDIRGFYAAR